jgi:ATP-dependent DNA ligase
MLASKPKDGKGIKDFSKNDWLLEEKYDGHRIILRINEDRSVQAWSRVGNERTLPPQILRATKGLPVATIDTEMYVPGGISTDVTSLDKQHLLKMVAFDILKVGNHSAMDRSQEERRALLEAALSKVDGDNIRLAEQWDPSEEALHAVWHREGEGGILKLRKSPYLAGARAKSWVKLKMEGSAILVVTGFEAGLSGPHSCIVGVEEGGTAVGTVKTLNREWLRQIGKEPKAFIGRRLLINFQLRTKEGSFRHPMVDRWLTATENPFV